MKSVRTRFLGTAILSMLVLSVSLGALGIGAVASVSKNDAEHLMEEICSSNGEKIDGQLGLVSQATELLSVMALSELKSMAALYDAAYVQEYVEDLEGSALGLAEKTDGVMSVYFRLNPKVVDSDEVGFFWLRYSEDEEFEKQENTKILDYDKSDVEHVGWYYIPIEKGSAVWLSPYYNQNVGVLMISYVIPCYLDGTMIGVIGMDCDFEKILSYTHLTSVYESSSLKLACLEDGTFYSVNGSEIVQEEMTEDMQVWLENRQESDLMYQTVEKGTKSNVSFDTLQNDMKVVVYVPTSEIYSARNSLLLWIILVAILVFITVLLLTLFYVKKIVEPLTALTEAMETYARGDGKAVEIKVNSKDEIGRLAKNYQMMMETIQGNMDEINSFARTDALTGLGNKQAYLELTEEIRTNADGRWDQYGIVVCDLNGLKHANDSFGHEMGDALIKAGAEYISDIFGTEKTFRIGGDEFLVIFSGEEMENWEERLHKFLTRQKDCVVDEEKKIYLSVAAGVATCPEDGKIYEELFRLADYRMYETKSAQKSKR